MSFSGVRGRGEGGRGGQRGAWRTENEEEITLTGRFGHALCWRPTYEIIASESRPSFWHPPTIIIINRRTQARTQTTSFEVHAFDMAVADSMVVHGLTR